MNGALFIQWTRTGATVRGTLSEAYRTLADPTHPQGERHAFTGVINGSDVTLTLDSSDNWNGRINGSSVTLSYTNSDGSVESFDFRPASVSDYNAAVASVQSGARRAQENQAQRERRAELEQRIESEGSAVTADIEQINQDLSSIGGDLNAMAGDVAATVNNTASVEKEMQGVLAEAAKYPGGNYGSVCADANTVGANANGVSADENAAEADANALESDFSRLSDDITTLENAWHAFKADREALPAYRAANTVDQTAVSHEMARAQAAVASARRKSAGYIAKAKSLEAAAHKYAANAQTACDKVGG